jgi:hypothetical protein
MLRSRHRKQNVRRVAPDVHGFWKKFQRVRKDALRFGRKPNPKWGGCFRRRGIGRRPGKFGYIFIIVISETAAGIIAEHERTI